jgi:hypothetical protein
MKQPLFLKVVGGQKREGAMHMNSNEKSVGYIILIPFFSLWICSFLLVTFPVQIIVWLIGHEQWNETSPWRELLKFYSAFFEY